MRDTYAEHTFEQKLRAVDDFARRYYSMMPRYYTYPGFEDIILDKLEKDIGTETVNDYLGYFTSYYADQEQDVQQEAEDSNLIEEEMEDYLKDLSSAQAELLKQQEEKFQNLSNLMCSLTGSVAISMTNIFASAEAAKNIQDSINLLTLASMAHLSASRAVSELFPDRNFTPCIVYARRAKKELSASKELLDHLIDHTKDLPSTLNPVRVLFDQALKAVGDFLSETQKLADSENDTPF